MKLPKPKLFSSWVFLATALAAATGLPAPTVALRVATLVAGTAMMALLLPEWVEHFKWHAMAAVLHALPLLHAEPGSLWVDAALAVAYVSFVDAPRVYLEAADVAARGGGEESIVDYL